METIKIISEFKDSNSFLSNFYTPIKITFEGVEFSSSEAAYQACKTLYMNERIKISKMKPGESKKYGRRLILRKNWDTIKVLKMTEIIKLKFKDPFLRKKLLETTDYLLIEGNTWHDNFWGDCQCIECKQIKGLNNLGLILMNERRDILYEISNSRERIS